jgi:hypothetical protein
VTTRILRRSWIVPAIVMTLLFLDVPSAIAAVPTITSFNPTSGPIGTEVTITGTGFQDASIVNDVEFNNVDATFSVVSDVEVIATVPAGATDGPIEVTDAEGTAASASNFDVTHLLFRPLRRSVQRAAKLGQQSQLPAQGSRQRPR